MATLLYTVTAEMDMPESERQPGFDEEARQQIVDGLEIQYANYIEPLDKALMARALKMAAALPPEQRIEGLEYVCGTPSESIDKFVEEAFKSTKLMDAEYTKSLFFKSCKELAVLNDSMINMAIALYPLSEETRITYETFAAKVSEIRRTFIDGLYEWKGATLYPDANGTIRFTSGPVKGYIPQEAALYYPFTTLKGVMAKNTGEEPFDAPAGLVELYKKRDFGKWIDPDLNEVPVAFLAQLDITGGNSGSPIMNAKGEMVGIVFDGNYEAMISDWQYDFDLQRVISVDIRYVLFVTEKFAHAGFLLEEMGVK